MQKKTKVSASGEFRRFAINVEAYGIDVRKKNDKWSGERMVEFDDPNVNVRMSFKAMRNAPYSVAITINDVTKTIEDVFPNNGLNHIGHDFLLTDFNL